MGFSAPIRLGTRMGWVTGDGRRRKQTRANASNLPVHGVATIFVGGVAIGVNAIRCAVICRLVEGNKNQVVSYFRDDHRCSSPAAVPAGNGIRARVAHGCWFASYGRRNNPFCLGGFTQDHGQGLGGAGVHGTNGAGLFEQRRRGGWLRQNANCASRRDCQPSGRCVSAVCPYGRWVWGICCGKQHDQQHDVFAVPV